MNESIGTTRRSKVGALLLLGSLVGAMLATALPAAAVTVGTTEGCTPGYWKQSQHFDSWQEYSPNQTISSAFPGLSPTLLSRYGSTTLLQALNFQGGTGVAGAERILLRAAVAALLNAAYDPLAYPWQRNGSQYRPPLVSTVVNALNSGDRTRMLNLAAQLDRDNNLGCPLS